MRSPRRVELPQRKVLVPPHLQVLSGLNSHCNYSVRVSCVNEVGASPFSNWLHFQTPESGEGGVVPHYFIYWKQQQSLFISNKSKDVSVWECVRVCWIQMKVLVCAVASAAPPAG